MTLSDHQGWLFLLFNCDFLITEEMFVLFPASGRSDRSSNLPSLLQVSSFQFHFYSTFVFACYVCVFCSRSRLRSAASSELLEICSLGDETATFCLWRWERLCVEEHEDLWWETAQRETGDEEERCSHLCLEAQILFQTKAVWALSGKGVEMWLWAG